MTNITSKPISSTNSSNINSTEDIDLTNMTNNATIGNSEELIIKSQTSTQLSTQSINEINSENKQLVNNVSHFKQLSIDDKIDLMFDEIIKLKEFNKENSKNGFKTNPYHGNNNNSYDNKFKPKRNNNRYEANNKNKTNYYNRNIDKNYKQFNNNFYRNNSYNIRYNRKNQN